MKSHRDLIDCWETVGAFAKDAGAKTFTAHGWRRRNNIPIDWWDNVVRASHLRGIPEITRDWLYETRTIHMRAEECAA